MDELHSLAGQISSSFLSVHPSEFHCTCNLTTNVINTSSVFHFFPTRFLLEHLKNSVGGNREGKGDTSAVLQSLRTKMKSFQFLLNVSSFKRLSLITS